MESLIKLADIAKQAIGDLKSIDSIISVKEGNIAFLESKRVALAAAITELEAKKATILDFVGTMEKTAREAIEVKLREIQAKEEQLAAEHADLKAKSFQADGAKEDAIKEKERYAALYAEYSIKVQEIEDKKQAVLAALK